MLSAGTYKARGIVGKLRTTKDGKPNVAVELEVTAPEDFAGERITWFGYFTEKTQDRTLESLLILGWNTDDLQNLAGVDANEVEIVVAAEEYEGKRVMKVRWINKVGGRGANVKPLERNQAAQLAASMKGRAAAMRAKLKSEGGDTESTKKDDIDDSEIPF